MWDLIVSVPDHCLSFYFDYLGITYTNGQSNIILFVNRLNRSLKRPLPFFILTVDQSSVRGRPESRNDGFGRPDSFMPTLREI